MEANTPITCLKNKLAELKQTPGTEPNVLLEFEKAILVLELIGSPSFDDIVSGTPPDFTKQNEPNKESKSYYDRFMEAQKNKNNKM